ncbi:MAG: PilZ domain-containing protein [Calditrichae bacterium]|nr:PilZ domain-containing protein [Calditrichota bacterium]MCB9056932.1 PilZ domain-containing protein [Calditrichia bacterium]
MLANDERRKIIRFKIPGSMVFFSEISPLKVTQRLSGDGLIDDISIKGIRFSTESQLYSGLSLNLDLIIPGREQISLKGNVVWISGKQKNDQYFAFVEFIEFSDDEGFNPAHLQNVLETILNEYA